MKLQHETDEQKIRY